MLLEELDGTPGCHGHHPTGFEFGSPDPLARRGAGQHDQIASDASALVDEAGAQCFGNVLEHVHRDDDVDAVVVDGKRRPRDDLDDLRVVEVTDVGSHDIEPAAEHSLGQTFRARADVEHPNLALGAFESRVE